MESLIEPEKGTQLLPFWLRVHLFDTIKKVKEMIETEKGISVHQQTLIFKRQTLTDNLTVLKSGIREHAHIKLLINNPTTIPPRPPPPPLTANVQTEPTSTSSCSSSTIQKINMFLKPFGVAVEMDINDSFLKLKITIKLLIKQMGRVPISMIGVYTNGMELTNHHMTLHQYQLIDGSEVEIVIEQPMPPSITEPEMKMIRIKLVSRVGKTIALSLNPVSNVGELRNALKIKAGMKLGVGEEEGCFFMHGDNVMDEYQSFILHGVEEGDTINIIDLA